MSALQSSSWPADSSIAELDLSVGQLLREAAAEVPDQPLLISIAPDAEPRTWTYAELLADAEHAAAWLLQRFTPGEHIAVYAPNVPEWVVLQYGAALAGLVLVTANPALRGAELEYLLTQSDAVAVAYAESFRGTDTAAIVHDALPAVPTVRESIPFTSWLTDIRAVDPTAVAWPEVDPASATQLQFTSGTTGFPKAAVLRHRAMVTNASYVHRRAESTPGTVWVTAMPLFHTAGCGMCGMGVITQRGTWVLGQLFDPGMLLAAIERYRGTHLIGVPAMLKAILAHPTLADTDLSSLQVVISGGDAVPADVVAACEQQMGIGFSTVYGQTELSPIIAQTSPQDSLEDKVQTTGLPLWNADIAVLDPATGQVRPAGVAGEVCARGYQTMIGYHGMPAETASTVDEQGWLHTGDLGVLDERGYLRITGRLKDLVIRGGENIYPREVEDALARHPAVSTAVVVGLADPSWGETVAAVLQLDAALPAPTSGELRAFVRTQLAPQKAPTNWYVSQSLPTNAMGKLQKFRLREQITAGELRALP